MVQIIREPQASDGSQPSRPLVQPRHMCALLFHVTRPAQALLLFALSRLSSHTHSFFQFSANTRKTSSVADFSRRRPGKSALRRIPHITRHLSRHSFALLVNLAISPISAAGIDLSISCTLKHRPNAATRLPRATSATHTNASNGSLLHHNRVDPENWQWSLQLA